MTRDTRWTLPGWLLGLIAGWMGTAWGEDAAPSGPPAARKDPPAKMDAPPSEKAPASPARPEVVVTGTREPSEALLVPAHVSIITAEEIERSAVRDVADVLSLSSGFHAWRTSSTPQYASLDLRGFNNGGGNGQHVLVLVDGRKTNGVNTSATDWASIPMQNIERIEVVRGPAAALYGDTAVGGVIHIITRAGADPPVRFLAAEAGSFGTFRERLFLSGRYEGLGYACFAQDERSDGFRDNSDYSGQNYTANLAYDIDGAWRLRAKAGAHDDDRRWPGALTKDEIATLGRNASVTPGDRSSLFTSNMDFGVERHEEVFMKGAGPIEVRTSAFVVWGHERLDSRSTYPGSGQARTLDDSTLLNLNLQHTSVLRLLDPDRADVKLTAGADLGYEASDAAAVNDFPGWFWVNDQDTGYRRRLIGLYAHVELAVTDALALSGGGRFDRALFNYDQRTEDLLTGDVARSSVSKAFDQWNPHAGVNYRWSATTSTYLAWGRTLRFPNRDELVGFLIAAPELRPERAMAWEAGVREEWGRSFTGALAVYRMDVRDEIFYVPPPGGIGFGANENVPRIRHDGVETEFRWQAAEPIAFRGAYTFARTTVRHGPREGHRLPVTPLHQGLAGVEVTPVGGLVLFAQTRYIGSRYLINDLDNDHPPLPAYAVTDVGARFRRGPFQVWATAFNVTQREYFESGGIRFTGEEAFYPAPGVNFEIGAQVDF
jgi:iron complex outermembrane receptor protein